MSEQRSATSTKAHELLREDPVLAPYVEEYGPVTVEPAEETFQRLVVSLVRQQVSMAAASAIRERLFDAVEITPTGVLAAEDELLKECGLSRQKATYLKNLASAYRDRGYDRQYFAEMADEAVLAELTDITGIGPWTSKMFLLFGLGRPDVFPVEDLGIRKGMELVCDGEMTRTEMTDRATEWAPYRSYASLYLWRAYEG